MKNNRFFGIDVIKTIAAILVISVHHFSAIGFYDELYIGESMIVATALYVIFLSCVRECRKRCVNS